MNKKHCLYVLIAFTSFIYLENNTIAGETKMKRAKEDKLNAWQKKAVSNARIMSQVKWTPVADTMPACGGGFFKKGSEYTGVPYSSVKAEGRDIGFDIFLKTFLAATQNPLSVLYTENLSKKSSTSAAYYGKVCSTYTSYALQCGTWYYSRLHNPPYRKGVSLVEPQLAQYAKVGDIIFTPPSPGSHVEIVTEIIKNEEGELTHVLVEDSYPKTTRANKRDVKNFNSHMKGKKLYRITNLDEWREKNKAESFLFPNYKDDSITPVINRVLLLDRGDWVPYQKDQTVKINIMDKDDQGVKKLVIKKGNTVVEEIEVLEKGVIERSFNTCGDYTAHCIMNDGSASQACEFSVCDLDFDTSVQDLKLGESLEIKFSSDNMKIIFIYIRSDSNTYSAHNIFVNEEDRKKGKVVIPSDLIKDAGNLQIWLVGENKYGRLKKRDAINVKK